MWANERRPSRCELRELCNFREGKFYGYKHSMHVMCSTLVWFGSIRFLVQHAPQPWGGECITATRLARQHIFNVILYAANKSLSRHRWLSRNRFSLLFLSGPSRSPHQFACELTHEIILRSRFWPDGCAMCMGIEDMDWFVSRTKMWQKRCSEIRNELFSCQNTPWNTKQIRKWI